MGQSEDLARLENFVEKLIDSHNQLKNENSAIKAQLQAKEKEIVELQERVKNLQEDRSVVHDRVNGLIDRIDEWQKAFEQEGAGQNSGPEDEAESLPKKSSTLFKASAESRSESTLR